MTTATNTTAPALNLTIGRSGKSVHLPSELIPTDPKCGGVRINGAAQARRQTTRPATCRKCLAV